MNTGLTPVQMKAIDKLETRFNVALSQGDDKTARSIAQVLKKRLNDNEWICLETTAMLAVCYIRMENIAAALPYIKRVLAIAEHEGADRKRQMIIKFREEVMASTVNQFYILPKPATRNREGSSPILNSVKNVFYKTLCNPEYDLYKAWYNYGIKMYLSRMVIGGIMISLLLIYKLEWRQLFFVIIAFGLKFSADVFCDKCKNKK